MVVQEPVGTVLAAVDDSRRYASVVGGLVLTAGTADPPTRLEIAVRDALAVGGQAGLVAGAQLSLARWHARHNSGQAPIHYRRYLEIQVEARQDPEPLDVAALVSSGSSGLLDRWQNACGDEPHLEGEDGGENKHLDRWLAIAVAGDMVHADRVRELLTLNEAVRTSERALQEGVESSCALVCDAASILRRAVSAPADEELLAAAIELVERVEREYGSLTASLSATSILWAAATGWRQGDPLRERLEEYARPEVDGDEADLRAAAHKWAQRDLLMATLHGEDLGDHGSLEHPRAAALSAVARAHRAWAAKNVDGLRRLLETSLSSLLNLELRETVVTAELRLALALTAQREGDSRRARAELEQYDAVTSELSGYSSLRSYVGEVVARGADLTGTSVARLPRHALATVGPWWQTESVGAEPRTFRVAPDPLGVARRLDELSDAWQYDVPAFVVGARELADDIYRSRPSDEHTELSLRCAQVDALLRLGRIDHALRVARWAASRMRERQGEFWGALRTQLMVAEARACLGSGDPDVLNEWLIANPTVSTPEMSKLASLIGAAANTDSVGSNEYV